MYNAWSQMFFDPRVNFFYPGVKCYKSKGQMLYEPGFRSDFREFWVCYLQ